MNLWLAYAQLVRLPNVFTAFADLFLAWAGASMVPVQQGSAANRDLLDSFATLLCLAASSATLYCGGMVWNDYFDLEKDLRERPKRPLPSGRISKSAAFRLGVLLIAAGLAFAGFADYINDRSWYSSTIAGLLSVCIFLYDWLLKKTWLGPYAMGSCRFFNVLLGFSVLSEPLPAWGYLLALTVGVYIVGVTWFAKTEARMSKQNTLLAASLVMVGGLVLGLSVPALALQMDDPVTPAFAFPYLMAVFGGFLALKVVPAVLDPKPARVQPAVKRAVLGLILLDAILATSLIGIGGLAIALLLVPALILGKWLYST